MICEFAKPSALIFVTVEVSTVSGWANDTPWRSRSEKTHVEILTGLFIGGSYGVEWNAILEYKEMMLGGQSHYTPLRLRAGERPATPRCSLPPLHVQEGHYQFDKAFHFLRLSSLPHDLLAPCKPSFSPSNLKVNSLSASAVWHGICLVKPNTPQDCPLRASHMTIRAVRMYIPHS